MFLELLQDAVLGGGQATYSTVLFLVQVKQLFLLLGLELGASVLHPHELLHPLLLVGGQVALNVLIFLKQRGQLLLLGRSHRLLKQAHREVSR